jgi:hypothetical protein
MFGFIPSFVEVNLMLCNIFKMNLGYVSITILSYLLIYKPLITFINATMHKIYINIIEHVLWLIFEFESAYIHEKNELIVRIYCSS